MRRVTQRIQFRNDLKRQKRRGRNIEELVTAVELLAEEGALPAAYRPHQLSEEWKGVWECHIEPDWLLIYEITETVADPHRTPFRPVRLNARFRLRRTIPDRNHMMPPAVSPVVAPTHAA